MTNLNLSPFGLAKKKSPENLNFLPSEPTKNVYQMKKNYCNCKTVFTISFLIIAIIFHMWFWIELGTGGGDKDTPTGRIPKLDNGYYESNSEHGQMMTVPLYFALIFSGISGIFMFIISCSVIFKVGNEGALDSAGALDYEGALDSALSTEPIYCTYLRFCSFWTSCPSLLLALICIIAANEWLKHWSTHICPLSHVRVGKSFRGENFASCAYLPWYPGRDKIFTKNSHSETIYHLNYFNVTKMNINITDGRILGGTFMFNVTNLGKPNASVQNDFSQSIIAIVLAFVVGQLFYWITWFDRKNGLLRKRKLTKSRF